MNKKPETPDRKDEAELQRLRLEIRQLVCQMALYADQGNLDRSWAFFAQLQEGNYPSEEVDRAMKDFGKQSGQSPSTKKERLLS